MKWFNKLVVQIIPIFPKSFIWLFSRRYVAGISLDDAVQHVRDLNSQDILVTMDVLGEDIKDLKEAGKFKSQCIETLKSISDQQLNAGLSIKLTQLGLCIDKQKCYENVETIVSEAQKKNIFIRIDMEDNTTTDDTLDIFRKIRRKYQKVGAVIQAYLKRSQSDVEKLIQEGICNLRICKGIYNESPKIAYKNPNEIRDNYMKLTEMVLNEGEFAAIATHDKMLVQRSLEIIKKRDIHSTRYEFQMLLGVTEKLRGEIIQNGHRMRVYVPYGEQWYGYCMRRMKENPQVAGHVIKNMFVRN